MELLVDCSSKISLGGSFIPDYSEMHMGYFTAYYSSLHTEPVPWWVQKDSLLGTRNSDVDHCNTHKKAKSRPILHALADDCCSEVVESIRSIERRA